MTGSPASRVRLRIRFSLFDTIWALAAPIIALAIRNAEILTINGSVYCLISLAFTLIAYSVFRVHDGVSKFFSAHDAWAIVKAVVCAELMTSILLFSFTRLESIPRSIPLIHALILGGGLIAIRALVRLREDDAGATVRLRHDGVEHIIMIGSTKLTSLFVKFLAAYRPGERRVIALLDSNPEMIGRTVSGVRVVGPPDHLQVLIDEFVEHGMTTDRVIVGGDEDLLSDEALSEVERVCAQRQIPLDFVPRLVGLTSSENQAKPALEPITDAVPSIQLSHYFRWKYAADFVVAAVSLVLCTPLLLFAIGLALLDVGWPFVFWQQRLGAGGRPFKIYKMRTLRPPFDQFGLPIPENQRLSWVGNLLRRFKLDELPQLINVLVGEMSLIGPRPLLPRDQPSDPSVRLMVRPGITGWAQVNGGTLLTPSEKHALDEWYVRNASFWVDLWIMLMTLRVMIWGQSRPDQKMADVHLPQPQPVRIRSN